MLNGDVPRWQSIHLRNQDIFTFRFLFGFCLVDVGDGVGRDYRAGEGLVEKVSAESMMAIGAGEGGAS